MGTKDYSRRGRKTPIMIGSGTILCANVVVNGGVSVGNNVVISANTAVLVDVPDNQVVSSAKLYTYTNVMRHNWKQFNHYGMFLHEKIKSLTKSSSMESDTYQQAIPIILHQYSAWPL